VSASGVHADGRADACARIAFCACYAMNVWHAQNFPFLTQLLFYANGTEYDQVRSRSGWCCRGSF
jgi:hypothetical protein